MTVDEMSMEQDSIKFVEAQITPGSMNKDNNIENSTATTTSHISVHKESTNVRDPTNRNDSMKKEDDKRKKTGRKRKRSETFKQKDSTEGYDSDATIDNNVGTNTESISDILKAVEVPPPLKFPKIILKWKLPPGPLTSKEKKDLALKKKMAKKNKK